LDEPTVGLDPITEAKLLTTIFETLKGKTIIWVTHHLLGVEKMDRILFLEQGRIIMEGNHGQLLQSEARYRRLYSLDRPLLMDDQTDHSLV
jgi:ATP-binding cassette subfamily C protein CydC